MIIGLVILAAAIAIGVARGRGRLPMQPTVYRMIAADGPVEEFNPRARPSPARITARGEGMVAMLTRKHMAGPGVAWFEPASPLVFALDSGDLHILPRERITAVERCDAQTLKIMLRPGSGLWFLLVQVRSDDEGPWVGLAATGD